MTDMSPIVLIPLVVFGAAVLGGLAAAAWQGLAAWRAFRTLRIDVTDALLSTSRRLAQTERRLTGAAAKAAELDRARIRLQQSLSTAALLTAAASETWAIVDRARGVVPRK
jgi:hypothetical protein